MSPSPAAQQAEPTLSHSTSFADDQTVDRFAALVKQRLGRMREIGPGLGDDRLACPDSSLAMLILHDLIAGGAATYENVAATAMMLGSRGADPRLLTDAVKHQRNAFQTAVAEWAVACFGDAIARDRQERMHRFLEEALELVQAGGCSKSEVQQLVDYVFGRPKGELAQEAGGVLLTIAAFCHAHGLDMQECGDLELRRVWSKLEKIREKQAAKPKHGPLPQYVQTGSAAAPMKIRLCREGNGETGITYETAEVRVILSNPGAARSDEWLSTLQCSLGAAFGDLWGGGVRVEIDAACLEGGRDV